MKLALMIGAPDVNETGGYVRTLNGLYRETVAEAAALGFQGVEVLVGDPDRLDVEALEGALSANGMEVAAFNSGRLFTHKGLSLLTVDESVRSEAAAVLGRLIKLAAPFRAPINIGMFRGLPNGRAEGEALALLADVLRQTVDAADDGALLLIEPNNRQEFPFICSTEEGIRFVERVNRPGVRLMLDTFHMAVEEEPLDDTVRRAQTLRHIHLLDRERNPPLLDGVDTSFATFCDALLSMAYAHYLSMPLLHDGDLAATAKIASAWSAHIAG